MKRTKWSYPGDDNTREKKKLKSSIFPLNTLLADPLQIVLSFAQHSVTHINTVCKQWYSLIEGYQGWYEMFLRNLALRKQRYSCKVGLMRLDRIVEIIESSDVCKRLKESGDAKYGRFLNYVGYMLNSKLRKLVLSDTEMHVTDAVLRYMTECTQNVLSMRNFHRRDFYLTFTEVGHLYTLILPDEHGRLVPYYTEKVDDNEALILSPDFVYRYYRLCSMTTYIHSLFPEFNEDEVIDKMMAAKKWNDPKENPYYGMTKEEIKAQWLRIRTQASKDGTAMHLNLELCCSGRPYSTEGVEFAHYQAYVKAHVEGVFRPYRTEWTIWSKRLELCGSVDILYEYINEPPNTDGKKHLWMADWKRSKKITFFNAYQSGTQPCTMHVADSNGIHYSLQQPGYGNILEMDYDDDFVIDGYFIVVLHPNQKNFLCIPIDKKLTKPLIDGVIQHRIDHIANRAIPVRC